MIFSKMIVDEMNVSAFFRLCSARILDCSLQERPNSSEIAPSVDVLKQNWAHVPLLFVNFKYYAIRVLYNCTALQRQCDVTYDTSKDSDCLAKIFGVETQMPYKRI